VRRAADRLALDGGELVAQLGHALLELAGPFVESSVSRLVVISLRAQSPLLGPRLINFAVSIAA
jgi:hypothetical protein